jgi:hypothetical protein
MPRVWGIKSPAQAKEDTTPRQEKKSTTAEKPLVFILFTPLWIWFLDLVERNGSSIVLT